MYKILIILSVFFTSLFAQVDAKLEIIKKTNTSPKIIISISSDSQEKVTLNKIKNLLSKDLLISGHFEIIDSLEQINYEEIPDIISLRNKGIDLFLNVSALKNEKGNYSLLTKLFDINAQSLIMEKSYTTVKEERYPFLSHRTAISINDYFGAPSISWMDKFVVFSVYKSPGKADIMIGDYTLSFKKTIVSGGLNIFPKWAKKDQRSIYYTSYNYEKPTVVKLNIFNRESNIIMSSEGMISVSDVNDNGSKILITAAPNSQPDIYLYNVKSKNKIKVTKYSGIDVGGQFIDNDKRIAFISDRLGSPNIFAKNINSTGVEKLVYHSKNNSSVTTFNDNIVYSSRDINNELGQKSFNLYSMSTKSDNLSRLTASGINQFPKFSTDGESLLFIKRYNNVSSLGIIRLKFNKSYLFPLYNKRIQSIDW